ncbi:MAG: DNA/RNA helicase domain-containing protein, partial [Planctomycetota bacterium]
MPLSPFGYAATLSEFREADLDGILGALTDQAATRMRAGKIDNLQVAAWKESCLWLLKAVEELSKVQRASHRWTLCLEYEIPRRGGRIDAVLIADDLLFVIEFKATQIDREAQRQAEDYALELFDFHEASHAKRLFPIACGENAKESQETLNADIGVAPCSTCPPHGLAGLISASYAAHHQPNYEAIDAEAWLASPYHPTPTIIEAARALYAGHDVRELSQSEASAEHLERTHQAIASAVEASRRRERRTICFITGTPGAGKTLAGLNVVHGLPDELKATFLSGNGPLVSVLQAVLANDLALREQISKKAALRQATTLVTNVHRWLEEYVDKKPNDVPHEDVVVFDEAQRA